MPAVKLSATLVQPLRTKTTKTRNKKPQKSPGRVAPSRAYTVCDCPQYIPHTTVDHQHRDGLYVGFSVQIFRPHKPCDCARVVPTVTLKKEGHVRRNPGRMDGARWNSSSFICASKVDGPICDQELDGDLEADYGSDLGSGGGSADAGTVFTDGSFAVNLLDIARPAKLRGIRKQFEVIASPSRVIALEEMDKGFGDVSHFDEWDEWEDLYGEIGASSGPRLCRTYASAAGR